MLKVNSPKGTVEIVDGRNVVKSAGWGQWGPEDVAELTKNVVALCKKLKPGKWGYMADPSKMDPILSKEASDAFVQFHVALDNNKCTAVAFLDGRTAAMKQKTQRHHQTSGDTMQTEHFRDEQEAMDWFTSIGIH